jgi:hypothetical protein
MRAKRLALASTCLLSLAGVALGIISALVAIGYRSASVRPTASSIVCISAGHNTAVFSALWLTSTGNITHVKETEQLGYPQWYVRWNGDSPYGRSLGGLDVSVASVREGWSDPRRCARVERGMARDLQGLHLQYDRFRIAVSRSFTGEGDFETGLWYFEPIGATTVEVQAPVWALAICGSLLFTPALVWTYRTRYRDRNRSPTACAGCSYDLRGSAESDLCPECGRSIGEVERQRIRERSSLGE